MAFINKQSIAKKVLNYAKSDEGKKRMNDALVDYVDNNVSITEAGSDVITKNKMRDAADELIKLIVSAARSSGDTDAIIDDISSLTASEPEHKGGTTWEVKLDFESSLRRASLQPNKYPGVTNIIALFNNGYPSDGGRSDAISQVRGFWHGEYISARPYREPLNFMQQAEAEFNAKYSEYGVTVTLDSIYEG